MRNSRIGAWALKTFRVAPLATPRTNVMKTLAQSFVFWGIFLCAFPIGLSSIERALNWTAFAFPSQAWSPWVAFAIAGCFGLSSGVSMALLGEGTPVPIEAPRKLVVGGPYRYIRNPMAVAGLTQGACVGLFLGSPLTLGYVLAGGLIWNAMVRPLEEADLSSRFDEQYAKYQKGVRCWIPQLTPYRSE